MNRSAIILTAALAFVSAAQPAEAQFESPGVQDKLPVFHEKLASRMDYPLSWLSGGHGSYAAWRKKARAKVMECLLTAPPAPPFAPKIIAEQDRGSYVARKVVFNVTGDSRVLAFLLVPKSAGPHPAVLLLHDHGAKFDIGKEKVIEPWDEPPEKIESARKWVTQYYGGRFIGEELARRGYVCLATDMLNWSDRGGGGYENQQALAANLLQFGTSFAGLIAHEDLRAAEFLATRPEVDPKRVGAMGLSVGGYRTWQIAALSDRIAAGVSVCWMATRKGLMVPKNNQTGGQSAFTMIHPGLGHQLDYPDVASIACPKPMMFLCGNRDTLFPVASIEEAFGKMQRVWESQNASSRLATRLYDAPHEFNAAMQNEAFAWLDSILKGEGSVALPLPKADGLAPFGGKPQVIPGTVEFENFDEGGEGVAFHDIDAANDPVRIAYRQTAVDLEVTPDKKIILIGHLKTGEWMNYTVDVAKSGAYELELSVASEGVELPEIRLEFDGVDLSGPIRPPTTSKRWHLFHQILGPTVHLEAGQHVMRVVVVKLPKGSSLNLDYVRFVAKREPKKNE